MRNRSDLVPSPGFEPVSPLVQLHLYNWIKCLILGWKQNCKHHWPDKAKLEKLNCHYYNYQYKYANLLTIYGRKCWELLARMECWTMHRIGTYSQYGLSESIGGIFYLTPKFSELDNIFLQSIRLHYISNSQIKTTWQITTCMTNSNTIAQSALMH